MPNLRCALINLIVSQTFPAPLCRFLPRPRLSRDLFVSVFVASSFASSFKLEIWISSLSADADSAGGTALLPDFARFLPLPPPPPPPLLPPLDGRGRDVAPGCADSAEASIFATASGIRWTEMEGLLRVTFILQTDKTCDKMGKG